VLGSGGSPPKQVEEDDRGFGPLGQRDGVESGAGLADDLHVGLTFEESVQPFPDDGVVVGDADPDHVRHGWASRRAGLPRCA
jgi:hypothetical protein